MTMRLSRRSFPWLRSKSIILIKPYRKAELAERLREALAANFAGS